MFLRSELCILLSVFVNKTRIEFGKLCAALEENGTGCLQINKALCIVVCRCICEWSLERMKNK
jgi:hypothetical protein